MRDNDEAPFAAHQPYFERPEQRRSRAVNAQDDDFGGGAAFAAPPTPYWVTNEMPEWKELRALVLELIGAVAPSAAGSVERQNAERELISAESNLHIALRARASELQATIDAMRGPAGDDAGRERLQSELGEVEQVLAGIEDDQEEERKRQRGGTDRTISNASNADSWLNALGETVQRTATGGLRIVKRT